MSQARLRRAAKPPRAAPSHKSRPRRERQDAGVWQWLVAVFLFAITVGVYAAHIHLPKPAASKDTPASVFCEERARQHLDTLVSFGPRTVGSPANEEHAVEMLLAFLRSLQTEIQEEHIPLELEIDLQTPSGAYFLDFLEPFVVSYSDVKNVVARLTPTGSVGDDAKQNALLVSSHFDSAIDSPGASDDGVHVAVMMELLRNLVHSPDTSAWPHALIFNFNGAEEAILPAAHGFITQHAWRDTIRAVINLESGGSGGRELLFQSGPKHSWLAEAYKNGASYPFANSVAQEIFQSGVIPSDTDYRVYRDHGGIPGIDIASIENSYVYHTKQDSPEQIQPGSVQRCGDNVLGLIQQIVQSRAILDPHAHPLRDHDAVFFDVLGLYLVFMDEGTAMRIHCAVIAVCLLWLYVDDGYLFSRRQLRGVLVLLASAVAGVACSVLVALCLHVSGARMSFFAAPLLAPLLYGIPAVLGSVAVLSVAYPVSAKQGGMHALEAEKLVFNAGLSFWLIILTVLTIGRRVSSYLPGMWVLFPLLFRLCLRVVYGYRGASSHPGGLGKLTNVFGTLFCASLTIPLLCTLQLVVVVLRFFVPLTGRTGTEVSPDVFIAVIVSSLVCVVGCIPFSVFFWTGTCFRFARTQRALLGVLAVSLVVAWFTFPYSPSARKRMVFQHIARTRHAMPEEFLALRKDSAVPSPFTDSGMFVLPFDGNGLAQFMPSAPDSLPYIKSFDEVQCGEVYCDIPWYLPMRSFLRGLYAPVPPPQVPFRAELRLQSSVQLHNNTRRLELCADGPDHMSMYISKRDITLTRWSFTDTVPHIASDTFFVFHTSGLARTDWCFWLEVVAEDSAPVQIAFAAHYLNLPTPEIQEMVDSLPEWSTPLSFASTWDSYYF